uniref:Uncharacterized protein n=1 Tax=Kalanchoe fedtschenkoi TaxID=63787 RepID=A0A7N0VIG6_KALFE
MGLNKWFLINKLRTAVKKISFLLNLNLNRFCIASMITTAPSSSSRLSFRNRALGLQAAYVDGADWNSDSEPGSTPGSSHSSSRLVRTESCPSSEDDIDSRAEMFIANFYRQLRMERQVSLELRYPRDRRDYSP